MTRVIPTLFVLLVFASICRGGDIPVVPGPVEITQALERGKSVRGKTALVPQALVKTGVLLKAMGIRYGHALVKIEDARGEGGAVYKLFESIKTCLPKGPDQEVIEYTGTFFLDADLSMRSGSQITTSTVTFEKIQDKAPAKGTEKEPGKTPEKDPAKPPEKEFVKAQETETVTADIKIKDGTLVWVRHEKRGDDPETISEGDPIKLHGVKPVPRNALIALAGFAAAEPGFKPGISSPFCVPSLDTGGMIDEFLIQPAWLETTVPNDKKFPGAKLLYRVRFLDGELSDKGLTVEPPTMESWPDVLDWVFGDKSQILALPPAPPESHVDTDVADPDTLDPKAPLDFEKIKAAMKLIREKIAKESDRTSVDDEIRAMKEKMKKENQPKK